MSKGKSDKITYKAYEQHQLHLLPPSIEELVPKEHLVRLVSEVIDEMGIEKLLRKYQTGGGASRYHPVMMTKVCVYGYMTKVCSSRMLAKAVRENILFMWLAGNQKPDFRTLNDFRGKMLKEVMEEIFVTAVKMLAAKGYVKLENYFVDGTKIESAAGRYTFVWKKAVEKHEKKLDEKLRAYIQMAEAIWKDENEAYGNRDLEELGGKEKFTSDDVKTLAGLMRERIESLEAGNCKKKLTKELKTVEKDCLPRKKKYEEAKRLCGERSSYSKTDQDAVFMRMKEDRMGKGQLKPGYNAQIGTENGFVTGYDLFQKPGDTKTLKPHLRRQAKRLGVMPKAVIADAAYGSEENYMYLERNGVKAIMPYNMYWSEARLKGHKDIFRSENWAYSKKEKYYTCPDGRKLTYQETIQKTTGSGYPIQVDRYECESCAYCRKKKDCTKAQGNRTIERNGRWLRLKQKARRTLAEERELRKRRSVEVETVFGQLKGNQGYRRFLLRGIEKVSLEWGLLVLGYNLRRMHRVQQENAVQ